MIAGHTHRKKSDLYSFGGMFDSRCRFLLLLLALSISGVSIAQNLTGIWRGYFITDQFEQYKFEIQIEQNGPTVQGVSYSYLNKIFYGKAALKGNYDAAGKRVRLQETNTIEIKMSDDSHSCIMDCNLSLVRSGREDFLEGNYTSQFEKSAPVILKGADCGDGKVYLRRVTESDFYTEPFLKNQVRNNKTIYDNQAPTDRNKIAGTPTKKTFTETRSGSSDSPGPGSNLVRSNFSTTSAPSQETTPNRPEEPTPSVLNERENELSRELTVNNRTIRIRLYDNGEIDGDTISVYVGKKLALSQKRLTATPLEITFEIPAGTTEQEVTMVAENLGTIPPNTSLMIVESGKERFEVRITSTEQKNAVVRFRYKSQ